MGLQWEIPYDHELANPHKRNVALRVPQACRQCGSCKIQCETCADGIKQRAERVCLFGPGFVPQAVCASHVSEGLVPSLGPYGLFDGRLPSPEDVLLFQARKLGLDTLGRWAQVTEPWRAGARELDVLWRRDGGAKAVTLAEITAMSEDAMRLVKALPSGKKASPSLFKPAPAVGKPGRSLLGRLVRLGVWAAVAFGVWKVFTWLVLPTLLGAFSAGRNPSSPAVSGAPATAAGPGTPAAQRPPQASVAHKTDPESAKAAWARCESEYMAMRLAEARTACEKALASDPGLVDAISGLGWVLFEMQDFDGALRQAQAGVAAATTSSQRADALVLKGATETVRHRETEALAEIQQAISLGYKGKEARARAAMLQGGGVPDEWARHILPRHACWKKKGEAAGNDYLVRRGVTKPQAFAAALQSLDGATRQKLEEAGLAKCPW